LRPQTLFFLKVISPQDFETLFSPCSQFVETRFEAKVGERRISSFDLTGSALAILFRLRQDAGGKAPRNPLNWLEPEKRR
jgi:hypothetical protein